MPKNLGSNPSDFDKSAFTNSIAVTNRPTEYRASANVTALTVTLPSGNHEAWIRFTAGADFTPKFPDTIAWIGDALTTCATGTTYEISIKDGVAIACEVGDGT